ncbi:MAG: NADPH-dependent 7-cyano-7-deazaguanine reductase QueF [Candidatus Omnitrophica bacterium CG1_02_49_10]|nr:MAG: NADPH-dependent 7-cyano-7-deazaguanine reductase QueF [Candidatus Omnitrophica bacterium CG1_02_49_10]
MASKKSYDNLQEKVRGLKTPAIETWANKYADKDYEVRIETSEFTCICPKTGLPDFALIRIEYVPDKRCAELKSFKTYLTYFRDIGIFHEHVINTIFDDFLRYCKPRRAKITGEFNLRGGIKTTVTREFFS